MKNSPRWAGLFLAAAIPFGFLVYRLWFLTDDAFISFRYAKNWAVGAGLRFNLGDGTPVEGFSNFLWTAILAGLELVGLDMVMLAPWISVILGLVLLFVLMRYLRFDLHASSGTVLFGLLLVALSPAFAAWSTGGLETMLFALLHFLTFACLLSKEGDPRPLAAGAFSGLMMLTRPEGIFWVLGFAALAFLHAKERRVKRLSLYLAAALAFFVPYLIFRWSYYGYLMPNTFFAKSTDPALTVLRGFNYTMSYLLCFITPLVLVVLSPLCLRGKRTRNGLYAVLICFAFLIYSIFSGGDFMAFGRFMAPSVPYLAILGAVLMDRYVLKQGRARQALITASVVVVLIQALPAFGVDPRPDFLRSFFHFRWNTNQVKTELEQWAQMKHNLNEWTRTGKALQECTRPGDTYVTPAIGAVGYYSHLNIHDMCGLVDLEVAHREVEDPTRRSAGHDKYVEPEYFLERKPEILRAICVPPRLRKKMENDYSKHLPEGYRVEVHPAKPLPHESQSRWFLVMQRRDGGA